jgi:hypothetical protein
MIGSYGKYQGQLTRSRGKALFVASQLTNASDTISRRIRRISVIIKCG